MREWVLAGWVLTVALFLASCGNGDPGTPQNHPLIWTVGLAAALLGVMGGLALAAGLRRRHERRDERRDERGPI